MALMDESVWRGKIYSGGRDGASGAGAGSAGPLTWMRSPIPAG